MHNGDQNLQRVFQQVFSAQDIANSLPSFDDTTSAEQVKLIMDNQGIEVAGVRTEGFVSGFIEASGLGNGRCADFVRPFDESFVVDNAIPLASLVGRLKNQQRLFVQNLGRVAAVVSRIDLHKPAARMWLFGMVTLLEMRFSRMIERFCPGGDWKLFLSEGRIQKAEELLAERSRRNQKLTLQDCLQFSDKVQIIARHEQLRKRTRFTSRRQLESVAKQLERLRNHLAHSQDIVTEDWDTIVALSDNLEAVLNEPPQFDETSQGQA